MVDNVDRRQIWACPSIVRSPVQSLPVGRFGFPPKTTGVNKGAQGAQPPNGRAKKFFLVKIEGISNFTTIKLGPGLTAAKSGRACYGDPTGRGYFYQMSNMYTYIAYLIEIQKFRSKNLVHKGFNFEAQNALKLTYEHL